MTAAAAAVLLLGGPLVPSGGAQAAPTTPAATPDVEVTAGISGASARVLADSLGKARTGGVYLNDSGRMVVAVTDKAAAETVRAAGGVPQLVTYNLDTLEAIHTEMDKLAGIPGTSWGVDPSTNRVSVELDSTVDATNAAKLKAVTGKFGGAVQVERIPGKIELNEYTTGGTGIVSRGACSLGFNVANPDSKPYFLTAGHCVDDSVHWYKEATGTYLGARVSYRWPGNDWGVIEYRNDTINKYGTVDNDTQQIEFSRYPYDGEPVSRVGRTSRDLVGKVLLVSTTVTYTDGSTVYGVIKTSLCGKGGDSGGPVYDGRVALGIHSGSNTGDDDCYTDVSDKRSYHQPVQEVLDYYTPDLHVY